MCGPPLLPGHKCGKTVFKKKGDDSLEDRHTYGQGVHIVQGCHDHHMFGSLENKNSKHCKDASQGWYRYDTCFILPVKGSDEEVERKNVYGATLVVRKTQQGMFLYDMINIKKEASMPLESK